MTCNPYLNRFINMLWQSVDDTDQSQTYGVLDGARDDRIYSALVGGDADYFCLYIGDLPLELAETAPYLVRLDPKAKFTAWLVESGWGESWGIFAQSQASMLTLRRHFRKFLIVYDEEGQPLYFRYYDPRVLRVFLPTCNTEQLQILFGPVDRYFVESEDGGFLLQYSMLGSRLTNEVIKL